MVSHRKGTRGRERTQREPVRERMVSIFIGYANKVQVARQRSCTLLGCVTTSELWDIRAYVLPAGYSCTFLPTTIPLSLSISLSGLALFILYLRRGAGKFWVVQLVHPSRNLSSKIALKILNSSIVSEKEEKTFIIVTPDDNRHKFCLTLPNDPLLFADYPWNFPKLEAKRRVRVTWKKKRPSRKYKTKSWRK